MNLENDGRGGFFGAKRHVYMYEDRRCASLYRSSIFGPEYDVWPVYCESIWFKVIRRKVINKTGRIFLFQYE